MTYGGQAVIEGVMMRGQKSLAIAMRAPDGNIVVHQENLAAVYRSRIAKIPFLRGVILLWDALGLGMRALTLSANTQTGEDEKLEALLFILRWVYRSLLALDCFSCCPRVLADLLKVISVGIPGSIIYWRGWCGWFCWLVISGR